MKGQKSKRRVSSRTALLWFWGYVVGSMLLYHFLPTAGWFTIGTVIAVLAVVAVCGQTWRWIRARRARGLH